MPQLPKTAQSEAALGLHLWSFCRYHQSINPMGVDFVVQKSPAIFETMHMNKMASYLCRAAGAESTSNSLLPVLQLRNRRDLRRQVARSRDLGWHTAMCSWSMAVLRCNPGHLTASMPPIPLVPPRVCARSRAVVRKGLLVDQPLPLPLMPQDVQRKENDDEHQDRREGRGGRRSPDHSH